MEEGFERQCQYVLYTPSYFTHLRNIRNLFHLWRQTEIISFFHCLQIKHAIQDYLIAGSKVSFYIKLCKFKKDPRPEIIFSCLMRTLFQLCKPGQVQLHGIVMILWREEIQMTAIYLKGKYFGGKKIWRIGRFWQKSGKLNSAKFTYLLIFFI